MTEGASQVGGPSGHAAASGAGPAIRRLARIALIAAAGALGGCTIVRVRDADGVRTSYYPGLAIVRVQPTGAMQVIEVRALGATVAGDQASLGWLDSRIVLVPPDRCQLVVWRAERETTAELRRLIGPRTELCIQQGK